MAIDYTIDIVQTYTAPLRLGDSIDLSATPTIVHPGGTSPTESYEWTNHLGDVIGALASITYVPPTEGFYSVQVEITYEDIGQSYERVITQDASFEVEARIENILTYNMSYLQDRVPDPYNNMDIHRFLSYMPKWSTAYKSFYSNYSKLISPIMEGLSMKIDDVDNLLENNLNIDDKNHFGYRAEEYEIVTLNIPNLIRTEHGFCSYIGEHGQASLETSPIKSITKRDPEHFSKESYTVGQDSSSISFSFSSNLYVKDEVASIDSPSTVVLVGIADDGTSIIETMSFISPMCRETINKFKAVFKILTEREITISNYIDLSVDYSFENSINMQKRIANTRGGYFAPLFELDGKSILVLNGNEGSKRDEHKIELPVIPERLFITNLLDIVYLYNNSLYASKMMLDYYTVSAPNSSTNNNMFIYLDNENTSVDNSVEVVIDIDRIRSNLGSKSIRVKLENGDSVMYIDSSTSLVESPNTWLSLANAADRIVFSIPIENTDPYTISVSFDNRADEMIAMNALNSPSFFKIADNINDIFIYDKELWCENDDTSFNIVDPVRLGFTSSHNRIHLFNNFNEVELIY